MNILIQETIRTATKWRVGLVGFCATFGSKYFGGYARAVKEDKITPRDMPSEPIRNLKKQSINLKNIKFINADFRKLPKDKLNNCLMYCDIPHKGTTKYKTESFPYDEFYEWCREISQNNIVLVSEYNMPDDFECIWQKENKTSLKVEKQEIRLEKLFIHKNQKTNFQKPSVNEGFSHRILR